MGVFSNILPSAFRPKNAANSILFGEASHPGPAVENFPLPVNGIPSSDFTIQQCDDLTYPARSEQIRQRQLFIQEYGLSALVGLHLWFPEVDLVGTTAQKPLGRRLANLQDARYATGTIAKVTNDLVTINWNGTYNTALPLHHFLCGATYLSERGDLYNKELLIANAIHFDRLFFNADTVPTMIGSINILHNLLYSKISYMCYFHVLHRVVLIDSKIVYTTK